MIFEGYDFDSITVTNVAGGVSLTLGKLSSGGVAPAQGAFLTVDDAALRFRFDGTAPTATVGHQLSSGDSVTIYGANSLRNFRAIRDTGAALNPTLQVTYLR